MTTMRASVFVLILSIGPAVTAQQTSPRELSLAPGVRIGASRLGAAQGIIAVDGPGGRLTVATQFGENELTAYDTSGTPLPWKVPTGRRNDTEIMYVNRMGWISGTNTLWVGDPGFRQVVLVDSHGKVAKSIENPSWLHPHWAERRKYPLFASMEPLAVYPDSSMLVLGFRERSPIATPGYDASMQHVLRVTWGGAIQRTVALVQPEVRFARRVPTAGAGVPGDSKGTRAVWNVSSDGQRIVIASPLPVSADGPAFHLTALDDRGDTVFSRRYSHVPAQPALTRVIVGYDHSVWVITRSSLDTARARRALVLDARGDVVGTLILPLNQTAVAVDRDHVWAIGPQPGSTPALIRYTVATTTAPPARTAPTSASSKRSRPPK